MEDAERQIAIDDLIHELFSRKAAEINNQGEEKQLAFLKSEGWTDEEIEEALQDAVEAEASKA
jgi:SOS response regulatory protein OraA/RecX